MGNRSIFNDFAHKTFTAKVGDKNVAENVKLIRNKNAQKVNALFIEITAKRSSLFNESNEIKPWKYNEFMFFDGQIEILVNLKKLLQEKESLLDYKNKCSQEKGLIFLKKIRPNKNEN